MSNLPRSTPEKQGVKSRNIIDFLDKIKEGNHELHSFMLLKNGHVISECWWEPYGKNYRHQLFSLSKSFTSTAIGMAVDEGLLTVDTLVCDIFKDEVNRLGNDIDEKMKRMTVKHLLTMGTGMEYENWDWFGKGGTYGNNIIAFLKSHVKNEPGSRFFYHTQATYMQSAIITRLTNQKLVDYLKPRLFEPLGISPVWEEDKLGISMGGFGLNITTDEIAKFGQFYLQKGKWNGKQLVSEKWIEEATSKQISNGADPESDWSQGYGYQFWMCRPEGVYRGDGMYGQFCIVMPEENSVIAITSNADMQKVLNLIWDILIPALRENNAPANDAGDYGKMKEIQKNLSHLSVKPANEVMPFPKFRGEYKIKETKDTGKLFIDKIYLEFADNECIMAVHAKESGNPFVYKIRNNEWTDGASAAISDYNFNLNAKFLRLRTYGEWTKDKETNENIFSVVAWFYETPVKSYIKIRFNRDKSKIKMQFDGNDMQEYIKIT